MTRNEGLNRRKSAIKHQSIKFYLFVEGQSEETYFSYFRNKCPGVRIETRILKVILNRAEQQLYAAIHSGDLKRTKEDRVALVMDVDAFSNEDIKKIQKICSKLDIDLYISNPAFETWLVMHFRKLNEIYSLDELEEMIRDKLGKPYKKSEGINPDSKMIKFAYENASEKIKDSEDYIDQCLKNKNSTTLHILLNKIYKLKT